MRQWDLESEFFSSSLNFKRFVWTGREKQGLGPPEKPKSERALR